MKFKIGDKITNGRVTYRIEDIGLDFLGHFYKLVNVNTEKKGLRYLKASNGSYIGETTWLCEQVDELFHLVQDKPQVINQNITINLHSTIEKVYTLTSVWKNGEHFEGDVATTVYVNKDLATSVLVAKSQEAKQFLLKRYNEEDINVEDMKEDYIMVQADGYADYWEGTIVEQTVIGER